MDPLAPPVTHGDARRAIARHLGSTLALLRTLDARKRLTELACFVGLWAVSVGALSVSLEATGITGLAWRLLGTVGAALAMNAFVLLLHEGMHGLLFARPALNRAVSVALGLPVLVSFTAYRVMHTLHHRYLGTPDDPDDYDNYTQRRGLVWALHFMRLTVGCFVYLLAIPFLAYRKGSGAERRAIVAEYALLAGVCGVLFLLVPASVLVVVWLTPAVVVAFMTQIRGFTQHGITDAHDPLLASRSVRANRLVSFLLLHENLHLAHHLFPEVPSYYLPSLQRALDEVLPRAVETRSYLGFLGRFLRASTTLDETPIGLVTSAGRLRR